MLLMPLTCPLKPWNSFVSYIGVYTLCSFLLSKWQAALHWCKFIWNTFIVIKWHGFMAFYTWTLYEFSIYRTTFSSLSATSESTTTVIADNHHFTTASFQILQIGLPIGFSELTSATPHMSTIEADRARVLIYGTKRRVKYQHQEPRVCHTRHLQVRSLRPLASARRRLTRGKIFLQYVLSLLENFHKCSLKFL